MTSLTSYKMEGNVKNEQKIEIFEKSQETPNKTKRPASGVCSGRTKDYFYAEEGECSSTLKCRTCKLTVKAKLPNCYKILIKNYYSYHFSHQTVNICHVTVNYRPTTVFHPWNFFVIYLFTIYRYRHRYRDIFQISYRYYYYYLLHQTVANTNIKTQNIKPLQHKQ